MFTFSAEQLREIGMRLFPAAGVQQHVAQEVVDSLVLSNLMGVDSHGIVRIHNYVNSITSGAILPGAKPEVVRDNGVAVLMDGRKAFGQIVAKRATKLAIEKSREHAIGAVSFTDVYHIGRLGEYVALAAEEGLIGLMVANGSTPGGLVAPFGARQRIPGTNPIAFAIPAGSYPSLIADFSTAAVAEGRVRIALRHGRKLPPGWLIDREGNPSVEPSNLYDGGAILTFGGYKGFALSLLVEILGGILSGGETPVSPSYKYMHNGVFVLVIDPVFFRPRDSYGEAVDFLFTAVKEALPGLGFDGALIPGEPVRRAKAVREKEGIPVDENTWAELRGVASKLNVSLSDISPISQGAGGPVSQGTGGKVASGTG